MSARNMMYEPTSKLTTLGVVKTAPSVEAAVYVLRQEYKFDHVTFHMAKKIVGCHDAPYVKSTYPAEWLTRYLLEGYVTVDPVVREGFLRRLPFHWSDLETTPEATELFQDATKHGVGLHGYTVPVIDRDGRRSLLSVTSSMPLRKWTDFIQDHGPEIVEIGQSIHRMATCELYGENHQFPHLSQREVECLSWTAQGKDSPTISAILHLSDHTVRAYLRSVRHKLDCSTLSQAVAKAIQLRIINP